MKWFDQLVEGRARSLQALRAERAEKMKDVPRELYLGVDSGSTSGKLVAEIKHVSKGFNGRTLFKDLTTRIIRGDRLGIVARTGAGSPRCSMCSTERWLLMPARCSAPERSRSRNRKCPRTMTVPWARPSRKR